MSNTSIEVRTGRMKENDVAADGRRSVRIESDEVRPGAKARVRRGTAARIGAVALFLAVLGLATGAPTLAQSISVQPGPLATLDVATPSVVRVGEPFTVVVTARDAVGNVVTNYAQTQSGVILSLSPSIGSSPGVEPSRIAASSFVDGVLRIPVTFTRAGAVELDVQDVGTRIVGRSDRIESRPGAVAEVRVLGPREARVGEPFDLTIELYDRYGNPAADYDRNGAEVVLGQAAPGAVGVVEPARISSSLFSQGRASVRVRVTQAELAVIAADAGGVRGRSGEFPVRAGALHAFKVVVPSRPVAAGEPFSVAVEALDALGNTITDFERSGGVVHLRTTGLGVLEPASIPPTAFQQGVAIVSVRATQAERIGVIAQDATGAKRGESAERIEIQGGRLGRFEVIPAENARAGVPLAVQVMGYDVYGNLVKSYAGRPMRIAVSAADASPLEVGVLEAASFRDGVAMTTVTPVKSGSLVVQVIDELSGAGGRGPAIRVRPGITASYGVRAPQAAAAHAPFEVELTALDRFGNVVDDYERTGAGVVVEHSGAGPIAPAAISASAFQNGVARVRFSATTAEEMVLSFVQQGGTARGRSTPVLVTHAEPRRLKVVAPARAVAGQPTRLQVTALDDYGNPVVSFAGLGRLLTIYTENGDPVAPPQIASSAFRSGVAELEVTFFRSGDVVVAVEDMAGRVAGKSGAVNVVPGPPSALVVSAPPRVEAGQPISIRIEVRDRMGNRVRDYSPPSSSLSLQVVGASDLPVQGVRLGDIRNMIFREGVAEVSVLPQTAQTIAFLIADELSGIRGRTGNVQVTPGPADAFAVELLAPGLVQAGSPVRMRLVATDAYGNRATSFGRDGAGVRLVPRTTGPGNSGVFLPSTVGGEAFREGVAEIYAVYDRAEQVSLAVEPLSAGLVLRPEIVAVLADERAGGAVVSILGNGPLARGEAIRLGPSLFELRIRGALLASNSMRVTRPAGIVSLVTLAQEEDGVRILLHTTGPAVLRAGEDANRLVIDVDPVTAGESLRGPVIVPAAPPVAPVVPMPSPGSPAGAAAPALAGPQLADIDRLVRENRFAEALGLVTILLQTRPGDAELLSLKRRLETLSTLVRPGSTGIPTPAPIPVAPAPGSSQVVPLQPVTQAVESVPNRTLTGLAAAEQAVRAGRYRDALGILSRHLAEHPGDEQAARMKQRLEQMIRILDERPAGAGR